MVTSGDQAVIPIDISYDHIGIETEKSQFIMLATTWALFITSFRHFQTVCYSRNLCHLRGFLYLGDSRLLY
jgi:hypothetical protein